MHDEQPMTVKEVANYLRIDRESVYRLCLRGHLTAYKPAGQWRIWKRDVLSYLETKKHRPRVVAEARPRPASSALIDAELRRLGVRI